ncbi:ANTAR domain-containing response regulator [Phosphitispora fastidiosa]|uniref:ANTAR domain-containing response regulator n=1 Tax=Phosphitispora fastidiosa TaxID=2837202 RepID=UPI001E357ECD|nr:ANTAR domain-containing protein [Phosphitispora fastidiosa]MBU7007969.1 response regulator NasT [Phosphitispora fastidiosa]
MERFRVIIAERDSQARRKLADILNQAGYFVVGEAEDGISALKMIRSTQPELVLAASSLPGMNGFELARILDEGRVCAVVLMLDYAVKEYANRSGDNSLVPVVFKPVDGFQLLSVMEYAYAAYHRVADLEREVNRLKQDLETRKVVARAKGILMKTQGLSEQDAFRKIQQQSMKKRTTMRKVAEAVVMAYEVSAGD